MKKCILAFVLALTMSSLMAQTDEDQIKKVIQDAYVDGLQNRGSLENIDSGFHPCFELTGIGQDTLTVTKLPIYTWRESVRQAKEAGRVPTARTECKFIDIDITGTAAVAKIELYRENKKIFTDYLGLYRFKNGWRIVNKIYQRHAN